MNHSFCIKTNNNCILDYLLKNFENSNFDGIYLSKNKFKNYHNIIIHYRGEAVSAFYELFSDILAKTIMHFYEKKLVNTILSYHYFYFTDIDKHQILNSCFEMLDSTDDTELLSRRDILRLICLEYLTENHSLILDGFVKFRLKKYQKFLDLVVDTAVNEFTIRREYLEFINLLKMYIDTSQSKQDVIHLIYSNKESILMDDNNAIISTTDDIFKAKYLSDITFSSNDFALNTLLTILPRKLYIHIIDYEDEFIDTLKLIFDHRVFVCKECNICKTYKDLSKKNALNFHLE